MLCESGVKCVFEELVWVCKLFFKGKRVVSHPSKSCLLVPGKTKSYTKSLKVPWVHILWLDLWNLRRKMLSPEFFLWFPASGWLWGRPQCNLFICSGQTVLHSFCFIQLFIFIMFVGILYFETSDPLGKVKMNSSKSYCGKNDRLSPSRDKFCIWRQAKRAGRDLVQIHIKIESRVKESEFKTIPESLQNLGPVVQSWAPPEYRKLQTMDHHSQIFSWDISV